MQSLQIGDVFGNLVLLSKPEKQLAMFRCHCGIEKVLRVDHVSAGRIKSCGCLRTPDLTGKRVGKLLVIRREPRTTKETRWKCQCSCGIFIVTTGHRLTHNRVKSCRRCAYHGPSGPFSRPVGAAATRHLKIASALETLKMLAPQHLHPTLDVRAEIDRQQSLAFPIVPEWAKQSQKEMRKYLSRLRPQTSSGVLPQTSLPPQILPD